MKVEVTSEVKKDPGTYRAANGRIVPACDTVAELALVLVTGTVVCCGTLSQLPQQFHEKGVDAIIQTTEDHINAFLVKNGYVKGQAKA